DYYGPSFLPDMPRRQPGITSTAESRLLGGLPADKIEKARKASTVTYVSKHNPPFFIVHGATRQYRYLRARCFTLPF
ncbi:MAG: hypothetical protein NC911_10550, partial [Candidatus Omnitrophica bacterium]|nr:hypothetical protein [Candidatus Omnitrophota bacterium]